MPQDVLQRSIWNGTPQDLGELFIVRKDGRQEAVCKLVSHPFGWECRLYVGRPENVVQTQVCRSQEEVLSTGEDWKAKMAEKGWG